jgi:catechol 2,3-dioxygenase-like lactoylglutathione lyase family enzyme
VVPARISLITLGARSLDSLRDFYKGLGWQTVVELDDFAAFRLRGAVLALFPLDQLAEDANTKPAECGEGLRGFTLAINVERKEEVHETIAAAREAGAEIAKEPVDADWGGRSGYFTDPEGNYWEVAWAPDDSKVRAAIEAATG